jgi:hypothetical protein
MRAAEQNSTVQAARQRIRGPTLSEQRLEAARDAEAADALLTEARKRNKKQPPRMEGPPGEFAAVPAPMASIACAEVPSKQQRRGRVRSRGKAKAASDEPTGSTAAAACGRLESKAACRRSKVVRGLGAAGAANLGEAPNRTRGAHGTEGDDEFEQMMCGFVDDNFHGRAVQERYLDARDLEVGLFGDFVEQRGHGKHVEWVYDEENEGWKIQPVMTEGNMRVPRPSIVMDYVIQVHIEDNRTRMNTEYSLNI